MLPICLILKTKYFYTKPVLILDIAIKGVLNVIEACIKNKVKYFGVDGRNRVVLFGIFGRTNIELDINDG